ncbi:sigma-70 family RNA polymerase sigma factor [Beduini massiliensis]|uniref:sigma-70 family RNA polymerase sigma factor n=1 Tax=Beduini massiliensis TaxID=1585974 RepID=UPI00059AAD20|nr:sigma-70 family RNA polymerase sigma factor [Beduini massiliensis]
MEEVNDYELLYLIFQGSECALRFLFKEYRVYFKKILNNYYYDLLRSLSEDDLLQEAQIVLYLVYDRYRHDTLATFRTFVRNCVEKRWYTMVKKATIAKNKFHYQFISLDQPLYTTDNEESTICLENALADPYRGHQPAESLMIKETLNQVYQAVEESKMEYVADIAQMKMLGYSDKEIAERLSISDKKVSNTIYRIRKKFDLNKH